METFTSQTICISPDCPNGRAFCGETDLAIYNETEDPFTFSLYASIRIKLLDLRYAYGSFWSLTQSITVCSEYYFSVWSC